METTFVGRETELAALRDHLDRMRNGHGRVVFVTGNPGMGKTELVREFARNALANDSDLIAAVGECDSLTGQADPYLPFKEILLQLTGDVDDKLAEHVIGSESARRLRDLLATSGGILVEYGPDLIGIFVPGAGLLKLVGTLISKKLGWTDKLSALVSRREQSESLEQTRLYEQYARVLVELSEEHPLLLVLEDMQWADDSSVELLFHLARRVSDHPIMVVVSYRSTDLTPRRGDERHPMAQLINEVRLLFGDVVIDLERSSPQQNMAFVRQLVAAQATGLPVAFAQTLYQITDGNPLFAEQLLRYAQDAGILRKDEAGHWIQVAPLTVANKAPAKIDAVIEERLDRLDGNLRDILGCASVIGPTFATEVISRVQRRDEHELMRSLTQDLVKRFGLLEESGSVELGEVRLYNFRFRHILFQQHLYNSLTSFERERLHRSVGYVLEALYLGQTNEVAAQLALHFIEGHEYTKAVQYLDVAAQRARHEFSNSAALENYQKLLQILERQPSSVDNVRKRIAALLALGEVYKHTGSYTLAESAFRDAEQLAISCGDDAQRGWALNGLGDVIRFRGDYEVSEQIHGKSLEIAERLGERQLILEGCNDLASLHFGRAVRLLTDGEIASASEKLRLVAYYCSRIIALAQNLMDYAALKRVYKTLGNVARLIEDAPALAHAYYGRAQDLAEQYGLDLDVLCSIGQTYMTTDHFLRSYDYLMRYLQWSRNIGSRRLEVVAHYNLGLLYTRATDYNQAQQALDASLQLNEPMVFRELAVRAWMVKGILADESGNSDEALALYRKGVQLRTRKPISDEAEIWRITGQELAISEIREHALPLLQRYLQARPTAADQRNIVAVMKMVEDQIDESVDQGRTEGDKDMAQENDLKVWLKSRVTPFRYQHTLGVHAQVSKLAKIHGVDPKPLRVAALLHDSMRDVPVDKMVALAEEWELPVRPVDRESPILLHGPLAIEVARREWEITDPVIVSAILYHTAGHKNMSQSDKVFFLADQTERNRTYPRVDEIRDAAMRDLDDAVLLACEINVAYVTSIGQVADPDTLDLMNVLRTK